MHDAQKALQEMGYTVEEYPMSPMLGFLDKGSRLIVLNSNATDSEKEGILNRVLLNARVKK